jgi:hypothetical protein
MTWVQGEPLRSACTRCSPSPALPSRGREPENCETYRFVRNGGAGNPSVLNKFPSGYAAQL